MLSGTGDRHNLIDARCKEIQCPTGMRANGRAAGAAMRGVILAMDTAPASAGG